MFELLPLLSLWYTKHQQKSRVWESCIELIITSSHKISRYFKKAQINPLILTMGQMTMCNVKGITSLFSIWSNLNVKLSIKIHSEPLHGLHKVCAAQCLAPLGPCVILQVLGVFLIYNLFYDCSWLNMLLKWNSCCVWSTFPGDFFIVCCTDVLNDLLLRLERLLSVIVNISIFMIQSAGYPWCPWIYNCSLHITTKHTPTDQKTKWARLITNLLWFCVIFKKFFVLLWGPWYSGGGSGPVH